MCLSVMPVSLPFLIQHLYLTFAIHHSHRRFSPPPLSPLASGSHPDTALPPHREDIPCMECEGDFHPRLSPVNSGRLGYLYGTSALYHSPVSGCVQRRPTYSPGQGFPKLPLSDELKDFSGFFLHRRRLLRQRQNPCVLRSYVCSAPCLPD